MATAFPHRRIAGHEVLQGGLINTNLKVCFENDFSPIVLRIYRDGPAACNKEVALHSLVHRSVPVAEIIYAHAERTDDLPSFAVLEYVEGITFQQLKRTNDRAAIHQAAASVGEILARIGCFQFPAPGELLFDEESRKLVVGQKFIGGPDPIPRILDRFLASSIFQRRAKRELIDRLHNFVWSQAALLPALENERSLVHNDYGNRNILVRQENGKWRVAAILDWELAISGSPLLDVGHFLRYERASEPLREPHFSRAFVENGGYLPEGWHRIVRLIDLTALVECLTHENLPKDVETELFQLIDTTLKEASEV
jgi:aminoglycoside phosphotransferase (APT) family kinase protein